MSVTRELPKYQCHKQVWALKIAGIERNDVPEGTPTLDGSARIMPAEQGYAAFKVDAHYMRKHNPQIGGYYVRYDDGYESFSPAEAFEAGYTAIGQD